MQYQAVLSNAQHPEYGVLTVPFPIQVLRRHCGKASRTCRTSALTVKCPPAVKN